MDKATIEKLEAKGAVAVLEEIARGLHGQHDSPLRSSVEAWVRSKQTIAESEASAKRDARDSETLAIVKEANRLASEANEIARTEAAAASRSARWAMYAAIIATVGAIIASQDKIFALIFGAP